MATVTDRTQARLLVKSISKNLGTVPERTLARLEPMDRKEIEDALLVKDELIGSGVLTYGSQGEAIKIAFAYTLTINFRLAKNLYTSNARFVFELLQNADDNHFTTARKQGHQPYVAFEIHRDRIVIDCNENGFTETNLRAICAVGKSSKTGSQGYIGEKGIGFKSVFMAAWKVSIQSGALSFHFKHRKGESGMGMICPVWEEQNMEIVQPLTRMTLLLHDEGEHEYLSSQRETIRQQFEALQENLLLFMRNLKKIRLEFFDDDDILTTSTTFSSVMTGEGRTILEKRVHRDDEDVVTKKIYHVVQHTVGNLAKNETRSYSEAEERIKAYATADVVLAFPVDNDDTPIVQDQEVFAFLPLKCMGFTFLIQSDFETQASRQDIVTTSRRNDGILQGIAYAFIKAVSQFCAHSTLQYTWMRFLPNEKGHRYDTFWLRLITMIKDKLRVAPVLRPSSESSLRLIADLRPQSPDMLDSNQKPLFQDKVPELYLSQNYTSLDLAILKPYGLSSLSKSEILDLVDIDLASSSCRLQSRGTSRDWHKRAASLLLKASKSESSLARVLRMPLLPLADWTWATPNAEGGVYFPQCAGVTIPRNLDLNLISDKACRSQSRRDLFEHLGVRNAEVEFVRDAILIKHRAWPWKSNVQDFVDQLNFFYSTHYLATPPLELHADFIVANQSRKAVWARKSGNVHFPDRGEFGLQDIMEQAEGRGAPKDELVVNFLHQKYFTNVPSRHPGWLPWRDWLRIYAGVRQHLSLVRPPGLFSGLSASVYYVAKHCPERFLGFLSSQWAGDGGSIEKSPDLIEKLREIHVLCSGGRKVPLKQTYLPFSDLDERCNGFLRVGEEFPFLELTTPVERGSYDSKWGFLVTCLRIGVSEDLNFYREILTQIRTTSAGEVKDPKRIMELYGAISGKYAQLQSTDTSKGTLRQVDLSISQTRH